MLNSALVIRDNTNLMNHKILLYCVLANLTKLHEFELQYQQKSPKKQKLDDENFPPSNNSNSNNNASSPSPKTEYVPSSPEARSPPTECLSPEQKDRINKKKAEAMAKLKEKQTNGLVTNVGESWFKVLAEEFSKPYFVQVYFTITHTHTCAFN